MAVLTQFSWLSGGFLLGLLCMYSIHPSNFVQQQQVEFQHGSARHLVPRATTSSAGIMKFGNPGPVVDLFERTEYTLAYDRRNRLPFWVGEHLTAQSLIAGKNVTRNKSTFKDDPAVIPMFRARTRDYTNSGYDRGHQAPAADADATQAGMDETFLMSNMAPQVGAGFNRNYWAYLEQFCRNLTKQFKDVYVYTGPLFLPQASKSNTKKMQMTYEVIGNSSIAVPTHFYKVILVSNSTNSYSLATFVLPNKAIDNKADINGFSVDLTSVERASGLQFFDKVDRSKFSKLCSQITCKV